MSSDFKNTILVLDDVLSQDECSKLMYAHTPTHRWVDTYPMNIRDGFAMLMAKKIERRVNQYFQQVAIDWSQVVKWPPGARQELHFDDASEQTILTSITYLNDTYEGGETYIENDMKMVPKVGRTVIFDGKYYKHGVTTVTGSTRYTLPIWYKHTK